MIVIADSGNWDIGQPALTTSLRGLVNLFVEVRVLKSAVHSGMFGGPVPDALTVLARLLATLHDDDGEVAVDGLIGREGASVDYPEDRFRHEAGMLDGVQLIGHGTITDRIWTKPAISVLGIDAPAHAGGGQRAAADGQGQDQRTAGARRRPQVGVRGGPRPPGEVRAVGRPGRGDAGEPTARPA